MTNKEFKIRVESDNLFPGIYILQYSDTDFLANQYIDYISKSKNVDVRYIDDIEEEINDVDNMFYSRDDKIVRVFRTSEFKLFNDRLLTLDGINIIVCNKIDADTKALFSDQICELEKLTKWQIADFLYSNADGVDKDKLDFLLELTKYDPYRLSNEIDKLRLFSESNRKKVFNDFLEDNVFSDMCRYTALNMVNCITNKDTKELSKVLLSMENIKDDYMGIQALLYSNFKKIVSVWLSNAPTEESTGLKSNQIYAIKKLPRNYSKESLIKVLDFLARIDYNIKNGNLPASIATDYMILKTLTL